MTVGSSGAVAVAVGEGPSVTALVGVGEGPSVGVSVAVGEDPSVGVSVGSGGASPVDRGREGALVCASPPSEPDMRISRIRLSGRRFYLTRIGVKLDGHLQG